MYRAAVLTVSDRVSRGERYDEGGPLVAELLKNAGYEVVRTDVVPNRRRSKRRCGRWPTAVTFNCL